MPIINQNNLMQSWTYIFVQLLQLVSFYINLSKKSVVSLASPTIFWVTFAFLCFLHNNNNSVVPN